MRLLLDTHTFLWFVNNSPTLTRHARSLLEDEFNELYLSVASVWEMAIKSSTGRLQLPAPVVTFIPTQLQINDLNWLPIEVAHLGVIETLPFHHKDPFDRLLIAQALTEQMPLVSGDPKLDAYGVQGFGDALRFIVRPLAISCLRFFPP